MTESDINLAEIEQKILSSPPKPQKIYQNLPFSNEKSRPLTKKTSEGFRKTFYNFNNIYKVEDFKGLTQKNFNQSQTLDERKHNLLIQNFRNNVATFLILRKYKGSMTNDILHAKPKKNKRSKIENSSEIFNNSNIHEIPKNQQEIEKIKIDLKIVIFDKNNELCKSLKYDIPSEVLQTEFMNKFTQYVDLANIEDSEVIVNQMTRIYDKFIKEISSKSIRMIINDKNSLDFVNFLDKEGLESQEEEKKNEDLIGIKIPKSEIIKETIEVVLRKLNPKIYQEIKSDPIIASSEKIINKGENEENNEKNRDIVIVNEEKLKIEENARNEEKEKNKENEKNGPSYMEVILGLRDPAENGQSYDENIIDKLLNAKDLFEVDLDFMRPKVIYPELPELQFKNVEEKKIFEEIHKWLFEIETELEEENQAILEYKRNKLWEDPQNIFQNDFPEAEDDDADENEENLNKD